MIHCRGAMATTAITCLAATPLSAQVVAVSPAEAPQAAAPDAGSASASRLPAAPAAQVAAGPKAHTPPNGPVGQLDGGRAVSEVVVTASRQNLLGVAESASQGSITRTEIELRPVFRPSQILETVPGLVVTVHSGEGKANQYLLRGFNLDHGTDFASFVDDMPVNRPTNTHGQGYSDQNFLLAPLVAGLDFSKGPYYAAVGDSGAVGSAHIKLLDDIPNEMIVSAGTLGDQDIFLGGTHRFSETDRLLGAVEYGHVDGPWTHPDNFHKLNLALRYSHGTATDGFDLTALYYHSHGNFTTDQPLRAVQDGLIDRFGTLDPSDGSRSERFSLSGHFSKAADDWNFSSSAYYIKGRQTLWNNFTHFLDDPVNGDQEEQTEDRNTFGGQAALKGAIDLGRLRTLVAGGLQARYDDIYLDRRHTLRRAVLNYCEAANVDGSASAVPAVAGACNADKVQLLDLGPYVEATTYWTPWLRSVVGLREEYYRAHDRSVTTGFTGAQDQTLFQPKGSLVLGPFQKTELYVSAGKGFHSDDARGVFGTVPQEGVPGTAGATPLLEPAVGEELGIRTNIVPRLQVQLALFREDFNSELAYNADEGEDAASAASRRQGVEISAQYRPFRWLELNTDLAFSRARYRGELAVFGLAGPYIENAPGFIGSVGVLVNNLGPWYGGLQWRMLGPYPILDGEKNPKDDGYSEVNLDVGYKINGRLKVQASLFNVLDSHANAAAYYYTARLPGEPASGVSDYQVHPLEPISARFGLTVTF